MIDLLFRFLHNALYMLGLSNQRPVLQGAVQLSMQTEVLTQGMQTVHVLRCSDQRLKLDVPVEGATLTAKYMWPCS